MSEIVERVARAIAVSLEVTPESWRDHEDEARAAIEAMREPTKEMIVAAMIQPHPSVAEAGGVLEQGREAVKIDYRAMIDEALNENVSA